MQLVDWLVKHLPVPDQVDTAKKDLGRKVTPWYFEYASGKAAVS